MEAKRAKSIVPSALQKPERRHSGVVSSSLTSNLNAIAAKNNANAAFASITCAVSGSPQFRTSSAPMLIATGLSRERLNTTLQSAYDAQGKDPVSPSPPGEARDVYYRCDRLALFSLEARACDRPRRAL